MIIKYYGMKVLHILAVYKYTCILFRGGILNRTYGTHKNLYTSLFLLTIFVLFTVVPRNINPFRTAVSFWGQLGTNYLEFECLVPKTVLEF